MRSTSRPARRAGSTRRSGLGVGESSPAVANGTVYIGDLTGVVHAVDAATGKAKWTFKTGAEMKSSPVVVGARVLIGSYDGSLYALEAATGKQLWKATTGTTCTRRRRSGTASRTRRV